MSVLSLTPQRIRGHRQVLYRVMTPSRFYVLPRYSKFWVHVLAVGDVDGSKRYMFVSKVLNLRTLKERLRDKVDLLKRSVVYGEVVCIEEPSLVLEVWSYGGYTKSVTGVRIERSTKVRVVDYATFYRDVLETFEYLVVPSFKTPVTVSKALDTARAIVRSIAPPRRSHIVAWVITNEYAKPYWMCRDVLVKRMKVDTQAFTDYVILLTT